MGFDIQQRMIDFVIRSNWYIFIIATLLGFINTPFKFALGILCGGLLVTVNFHLLRHTLYKAFDASKFHASQITVNNETVDTINGHSILSGVIFKYYIRFAISGIVIFTLINKNIVEPMGLVIGLSVVVASIMAATALELTRLIFKEAV
ncbi:MAG: ATP synthase subunit I [Desulfamplus sp.]|nr:ATP synthase subunit I [Desulfamplus sp.]